MYDILVIGAGPSGLCAAMYAAKKNMKTLVLDKAPAILPHDAGDGGLVSFFNVHNTFEKQLKETPQFLEFQGALEVISVEKNIVSFSVEINDGSVYYAKSIVIATGADMQSGEGISGFDLLTLHDTKGKIKIDEGMQTSVPGIYAVGEVTTAGEADVVVCVGQGAKAALAAAHYLHFE